mmetsp:Transcript_22798/g.44274  ORF Transcript_22798/g.44274 Transcript_22798/m.44274 type:complete len:219 (+) Transcript_22798:49-705(+)|eukprot:CAMPEP_0172681318 /NCGR_PEP_ID=MMETSP1074-20121228/17364_1 /TAXON_ID=2916 /ORGANISM="Ceratium fusus, Strain PA161109" /LENGTH=218 /DNA_ID=CAMNT_0013499797 /DNA_START=43 /DNA_END=699 /DNA_ORIENTATION=-
MGINSRRLLPWFVLMSIRSWAYPFDDFEIKDAEADIRDLDVGDLSDMETDVTPMFLDELKKMREKPVAMDMSNPMDFMMNSQGGTQMSFATLTQQKAEQLGKEGTEKLAGQWTSMLQVGGVSVKTYATDPGRILFVTNGQGLMGRLKQFVLEQPDIDWFEFQQQKNYPNGRTAPLMDNDARNKREIELGWRKPQPPPRPAPQNEKKEKKKKKKKNAAK